MPDPCTVDILLGTYNGARYIEAQLSSLQQQQHAAWRLLVRDDGSSDDTLAIVERIAGDDARIAIIRDDAGSLGFGRNFRALLGRSDADYSMYCDQDDVWLPTKISATLERMRALEARHPGTSILVHCDCTVVDEALQTISKRFVGARAKPKGLPAVLFNNCAQGSALMMNAALRAKVLSLEPDLPHDFHAALIAETTGLRAYIDQPLFLYRQHRFNAIGAPRRAAQGEQNPTVPALLRRLQFSLEAAPKVQRVIRHFESQASPAARRHAQRYGYVLGGPSKARRLFYLAAERYPSLRPVDRARLALAILRGLV